MVDVVFILGYVILTVICLFVSIILLDRYWGSAILGGIVQPVEQLIFEGRSWWVEDALKYQVVGIPLPMLLGYTMVVAPDTLPFVLPFLLLIWIPLACFSLTSVLNHKM